MSYVRLLQDWTDPSGWFHQTGECLELPSATAHDLVAGGVGETITREDWVKYNGG